MLVIHATLSLLLSTSPTMTKATGGNISLVLATNINSCPSSNHLEARFSSLARLEVLAK
jgi:hypothetical protein